LALEEYVISTTPSLIRIGLFSITIALNRGGETKVASIRGLYGNTLPNYIIIWLGV
jgi:hypothetical protein